MIRFSISPARHAGHRIIRSAFAILAASWLITSFLSPAFAARDKSAAKPGNAEASLQDYVTRMKAAQIDQPTSTGSLWTPGAPFNSLAADYKARWPGDLIVIRLVDSFSAATTGENNTSRQFSAQSAISALLGKVKSSNALQNLFTANSATALDGKGASTMSSNLQLNLSGHVVDMLPNGVLVVEAVRDFTVGNDRQTVTVRGLVRPGDLAPDNSVLSNQVTNLELVIKGKGAVAEATARPNPIVRLLLKVLTF